jgi:microcin C transport system substrate-binding protein
MKFKLYLSILTFISSFFIGCGGSSNSTPIALRTKPVSMKQFDTPQGADPSISAEMGGNGFENIAEGLGFETYSPEPDGDPNAKKGGRFTMRFTEFPATLRPIGKDSSSEIVWMLSIFCYESLIGYDSEIGEIVPGLATHWKISDDGRTFQFRIDPNARWSDGKPVIAEDVVSTFHLNMNEGILEPRLQVQYGKYSVPKAISKYIVEVSSNEKHFKNFLDFGWSLQIFPSHIIGDLSAEEYLEQFHFDMMPGSGPYTFIKDKMRKGKSLTLVRRSDWWQRDYDRNIGGYNFDEFKFVIVNDDRLTLEKFKKGELDYYTVGRAQWWVEEFDVTDTEFDFLHRGLIQKKKVFNYKPKGTSGLAFNMRREPFNDIRIRKAFAKIWNREQLIEKLFFDEYVPLKSFFPGGPYENPNNELITYDPDGAVQLLADAGWVHRNNEGWLEKNGKIFEVDFGIAQSYERIFTPFQEDLAKVGIKMNLKYVTSQTMFKKVLNERDFDIHYQSWTMPLFPGPDKHYGSEMADIPGTTNITGVKNADIDEISKAYNEMFDAKDRTKALQKIDSILHEMVPYAHGWGAPYTIRCAYWNKFGMPESVIGYSGDWYTTMSSWWYEPELAIQVEQAKKDNSMSFPYVETEYRYQLKK